MFPCSFNLYFEKQSCCSSVWSVRNLRIVIVAAYPFCFSHYFCCRYLLGVVWWLVFSDFFAFYIGVLFCILNWLVTIVLFFLLSFQHVCIRLICTPCAVGLKQMINIFVLSSNKIWGPSVLFTI